MNESDRLIAERMGWIACSGDHWGDKIHWKRTLGCAPFDLIDARDREHVIAWLNAQGWRMVRVDEPEAAVATVERMSDGHPLTWFKATREKDGADYKAVAFRAAVLAATEGKEQ